MHLIKTKYYKEKLLLYQTCNWFYYSSLFIIVWVMSRIDVVTESDNHFWIIKMTYMDEANKGYERKYSKHRANV